MRVSGTAIQQPLGVQRKSKSHRGMGGFRLVGSRRINNISGFLVWSETTGITAKDIEPLHVAAYVEA